MTTLSDIVEQLKYNREASEDTTEAVSVLGESFKDYIEVISRQSFGESETAYEAGRGLPATKPGSDGSRRTDESTGGFLSGMFKPLLALFTVTGPFGRLLAPIARLSSLFKLGLKRIPLIAGLLLIYDIFKDIGENENFKATMESIKATWNEKIVPTFDKIRKTFSDLSSKLPEFDMTFTRIGTFFDDFKTNVQDIVLNTIDIFLTTVGDILTGVDQLLNGDFKTGFTTIGKALFNGVVNLADVLFTNVLEMFGADFGKDGSAFKFIGYRIDALTVGIEIKWMEFTSYVKEKWNNFTTDLKNLWLFFSDPQTEGSIPATFVKIKNDTIAKGTAIYDSIMDKVNGFLDAIVNIIPSKKDITNYFRSILPESVLNFLGISPVEEPAIGGYDEGLPLSQRQQSLPKPLNLPAAFAGYENLSQQNFIDMATATKPKNTSLVNRIPNTPAANLSSLPPRPGALLPPIVDASQQTTVNNTQSTRVQLSNNFPAALDNHYSRQYMGIPGFGYSMGTVF